ncbi:MAG: GNAT family N-acetyltransferase [Bacteroidales bacterium]|nr:GNAT family N-acetyltransferase [Bacteroidales bacterium]
MIRQIIPEDASQICEIYNHYILHDIFTFEEKPVPESEMKERINTSTKFPWIVFEEGDAILGFAYASEWKSRCAYKYSAESTIYLRRGYTGKGIGRGLYTELFNRLIPFNIHAIIGGIALPNNPSIAFHESFGFKKVAHFKEVGFKFEKWIDVGYWELIL